MCFSECYWLLLFHVCIKKCKHVCPRSLPKVFWKILPVAWYLNASLLEMCAFGYGDLLYLLNLQYLEDDPTGNNFFIILFFNFVFIVSSTTYRPIYFRENEELLLLCCSRILPSKDLFQGHDMNDFYQGYLQIFNQIMLKMSTLATFSF